MRKLLLFCYFVSLTSLTPPAAAPSPATDARWLHSAHQLLTEVIVGDVFSPPVASRIYAYAHIAAYETLISFQVGTYRSLAGQVHGLSSLPVKPPVDCQPSLAATEAFLRVGRSLIFSEEQVNKGTTQLWARVQAQGYSVATIQASKEYGDLVAQHILTWAKEDHYRQTRSLRRYAPTRKAGAWAPTPPGYLAAVEPYWGRIRPLVLDSATQCPVRGVPVFSTASNSPFYEMAREVHDAGKHLSPDQRLIANYWDCNPFFLNTQGHLNFASKKLSPGAHWLSIAGQVSRQTHADLITTSAVYTLTAIALFDGLLPVGMRNTAPTLSGPKPTLMHTSTKAGDPFCKRPRFLNTPVVTALFRPHQLWC